MWNIFFSLLHLTVSTQKEIVLELTRWLTIYLSMAIDFLFCLCALLPNKWLTVVVKQKGRKMTKSAANCKRSLIAQTINDTLFLKNSIQKNAGSLPRQHQWKHQLQRGKLDGEQNIKPTPLCHTVSSTPTTTMIWRVLRTKNKKNIILQYFLDSSIPRYKQPP